MLGTMGPSSAGAAAVAALLVVAAGWWVLRRLLARLRALEAEQAALRAALYKTETALAATIRKLFHVEQRLTAPDDRRNGPADKAARTGEADCVRAAALS